MVSSNRIAQVAVVAVVAVAAASLAVAAARLRRKHEVANRTVEDIHRQIDALDPVTRAEVVARLSADEAKHIHDERH
jgi:hypothetical protein